MRQLKQLTAQLEDYIKNRTQRAFSSCGYIVLDRL